VSVISHIIWIWMTFHLGWYANLNNVLYHLLVEFRGVLLKYYLQYWYCHAVVC